jgi:hypothetical protein
MCGPADVASVKIGRMQCSLTSNLVTAVGNKNAGCKALDCYFGLNAE